jgi:exonuclease III
VLCLQEVKIAHTDTSPQNAVKRAVNDSDDGPKYHVFFTLPTDKFNARGWGGKVYGVCTIIRKDFYETTVERVRDVEWDKEGRVSIIELKHNLEIWNVYAVNGTDNPWRDPKSGAVIGTRHDKKLLMHRNLVEDCKKAEASGKNVVIIGDLNVAPARIDGFPNLRTFPEQHVLNRKDFNEKFLRDPAGLRAVDVWRELKGEEKRYTYFPRGRPWESSCDRVDLIIASKRLFEAGDVVDAEIFDSEEERGPSDHVPLAVELRLSG